ncbi:hypothetical protein GWA97_07570 [Flavobacterium sp. LaA7.5]|nr:hypothetical protein [Flavobacterium salilacus subsp. altitudinum]
MKKVILIVIVILLTGCSGKKQEKVELQILNNEIYYSGNDTHRYKSQESRRNSQNLITYKIINNTKDNLVFIINTEELYPSIDTVKNINGISFNIKDKANKLIGCSVPLITPELYEFDEKISYGYYKYQFYNDSVHREKAKLMGFDKSQDWSRVDRYIKNSFILHSGESKTFKTILSLPILAEFNPKFEIYPAYYENLKDNYKFFLYYGCDSKFIENILPEYLKQDLESNNVKIFDGIITSESLPLVEK